ncbi:VOC family protein [Paraburkholderia pallida]|uniref:Glyoxalase n=1 Tax=Paraburkholderia pallida TaxID=2547399 RepID=A0A4P7D0D1_9BURK|nr:VOC family protein [Paraburkholderia pallida]QBR01308.1 glyoxalase [Paraburkholderia pallida]
MLRYQRLARVDLNVTNLDRSREFYEEIVGLTPMGLNADGSASFLCGTDDCVVVLHESAVPGYRSLALSLEDESAFDELGARLSEHHIAWDEVSTEECNAHSLVRAWRIAEPNTGAAFEFCLPRGIAVSRTFKPTVARIQRIGHVVFCTPRRAEAVTFMQNVLGFATSDDIDGVITLMRPPPNPYHHGVGVGLGSRDGLHHVNFMVSAIDDIGVAINRFKRADVPIVFGPGRHPASESVFLYFLDPDGLTLEYSFGMEEFPEVSPREPRLLPPVPESIDGWGGIRDPRMSATGLVQPYRAGSGWQAWVEGAA